MRMNSSKNKVYERPSGHLGSRLKSYDKFGQQFKMKLDGAIASHNSYMGATLTLVLELILLMYFVTKIISIYAKWEVDIMSVKLENALTFDDKFDSSNGLFIAAAITEYDDNPEVIEVPEKYGELVINHYRWGHADSLSWQR